jgi:3-hydroxyacyl-[acyl-carrier-protein] dehydratase
MRGYVVISHQELKALLPHRYPMLLIDRVTELALGSRIVAIKAVTANEPCFAEVTDDPTAGPVAYPHSLIIESLCQAGAVLVSLGLGPAAAKALMLFGGVAGLTIHRPVYPGSVLEHHVWLSKQMTDVAVFGGEVRVGGHVVVDVERVTIALRQPNSIVRS